jgi:hypothetical protein
VVLIAKGTIDKLVQKTLSSKKRPRKKAAKESP